MDGPSAKERDLPSAPVLPPKPRQPESLTTSFRLPADLLERLEAVAAARGYSRNEVVVHFLRWAVEAFEEKHGRRER